MLHEEAHTEPLPVEPGRFEAVPLPPGTPALRGVSGLGDDDVWMVAEGGVLRWDGKRVEKKGRPRCFADACCGRLVDCARDPSKCGKPCRFGDPNCANEVDFDHVRVTGGVVIVSAVVDTGGLTRSPIDSRLDAQGRWSCEQADGDGLLHAGSQDVQIKDHVIHLDTPSSFINAPGAFSVVVDGRRLAMPSDGVFGTAEGGLAASAVDDLWFWSRSSLYRGDGLSWTPIPTGLTGLSSVWITEPGTAWALGVDKQGDGEGEQSDELIRWDLSSGARTRFFVPGAADVLDRGGREFWLIGKQTLRHWDGRALRAVEAPFEDTVSRAWLSPGGTLWVVGEDPAPKAKGAKSKGAAFRFVPAAASARAGER